MSAAETDELRIDHDVAWLSDVWRMNATFISVDGIESLCRYNVGIRNRLVAGHAPLADELSRRLPNDNPMKGVRGISVAETDQLRCTQAAGFALATSAGDRR